MCETIAAMLTGVAEVRPVDDPALDALGVDYVARLTDGALVAFDEKIREPGASVHWKWGPEVALETWSVIPDWPYAGRSGAIGWTLNRRSLSHYIVFTFDPSDSCDVYMLPFQLLRSVFERQRAEWAQHFDVRQQTTDRAGRLGWRSECIFVPAETVYEAVYAAMKTTLQSAPGSCAPKKNL